MIMLKQQCEQCNTPYGDLHRAGEDRLFACKDCGREACERCVEHEPSGPQTWFLRCSHCRGYSLEQRNLSERFSSYSSLSELKESRYAIAMLFVPKSVYSKRNETLIREAIPGLQEFNPSFFLLNENETSIRNAISGWFPSIGNPREATGNGAVIWFNAGQPVSILHGGPYLTELEILERSRTDWF
ncbi:hypothetical protein Pan241w_37070 [Gimesia alba]|uniref:Uncharacterized protein n=1 Tax=Gimesia alba TaxID=2527973 RepID=A0A517RI96_9PLAN|nr:hypothetical protein [Gimesia alba]QDT43605.1 hypothetical protein Pan241w_37070 [Gimesia alba]